MKKYLILITIMCLVLTGCGTYKLEDAVNDFTKSVESSKSYKLNGTMEISSGEEIFTYNIDAYFLKDDQNVGRFQASLDATLFKEQIAKPLNITSRYLGNEPYSKTTNIYNEELNRVLPPDVEVKIIDRKKNKDQDIISATKVRAAIANDNIELVKKYVPDTTLEFIKNNWSEFQTRIKEGSIK